MPQLTLGLPKGSLEATTLELFRKSGWKISGEWWRAPNRGSGKAA